jgi:hypothetical protein
MFNTVWNQITGSLDFTDSKFINQSKRDVSTLFGSAYFFLIKELRRILAAPV